MLKKTFISSLLPALLVALSGGFAQAGIIDDVLFSGSSGDYSYEFDVVNLELTLYETLYEPGSLQIDISGDTPIGSIFQLTKQIENTTGITWTEYELTVSGGTFTGTAWSDKFPDIYISAALDNIVFSGGTVENSQTVRLEFGIDVPLTATGLNFSMTQTAIPEPATIALLGLGSLMLVRRKHRR